MTNYPFDLWKDVKLPAQVMKEAYDREVERLVRDLRSRLRVALSYRR